MGFRAWQASLIAPLVILALSGCAKKEEPKPVAPPPALPAPLAVEQGKVLFQQKCGVCHGLDRATARAESKERWNAIIDAMQSKKADWITDADAEKILEYLTAEHGTK